MDNRFKRFLVAAVAAGTLAVSSILIPHFSDILGKEVALSTGFLTVQEALARPGTVVVSGTYTQQYRGENPAGKTFDMREFLSTAYHESETSYPLTFKDADSTYVIGPTVQGSNPNTWTWQRWEQMDKVGSGLYLETKGLSGVYGYVADDVFDLVQLHTTTDHDTSAKILLAHAYGTNIHDDCIENDKEMSIVVRDLVCNGSHMGISIAQDFSTPGTSTKVYNSTIILRPKPNEKADDGKGHAVLFKQIGAGTVTLKNFNACYTENPLESDKLKNWPPGTYENVKIVLGKAFTMPLSSFGNVPAGVSFTRDWSICKNAIDSWKSRNASYLLAAQSIIQPKAAATFRIAAAGDIASGSCCDNLTANLINSRLPRAVLTLGDNQYPDGDYADFLSDYANSWGSFKGRTFPSPGNHDYHVSGASGFYQYFGSRAPAKYYTYVLGAWRFFSMNNYESFDAQTQWLKDTMANDQFTTCQLAYWHEPRWSSGDNHGSDSGVQDWWAAAVQSGVDIVLNGHDHEYERFAKLDVNGNPGQGTREFVVGTGGAGLYSFGTPLPGSKKRIAQHGVLFLTLRDTSYTWAFRNTDGTLLDYGTTNCH